MSAPSALVWILGDQLLLDHPALQAAEQEYTKKQTHIVVVESTERIQVLPYQRKKLVLLVSAMRHYANRLRERGYSVDYIQATSFIAGLQKHVEKYSPERVITMAASEYNTRQLQQQDLEKTLGIPITVLPNTQFLVEQYNPNPQPKATHYIMETFYRAMRRHFTILMDDDKPVSGEWNYDKMNREPLSAFITFPAVPGFEPDEITRQVMAQVEQIEPAVGTASAFDLAVTHEQAQQALHDFIEHRLPTFGPYEDAMSSESNTLFHSLLSPYLNIGLLNSLDMLHDAEAAYRTGKAPLQSVEGFIRQILGWREFMYWQYWQQMPGLRAANSWKATRPMPLLFWNGQTDMNCLSHVVNRVLETGYSHHIERLMIVCNFCLIAGVDPAAVAEWFLACYFDAYDWVVLPNVIGMGLNADSGRTATKPYISSANYINKMSDYCQGCVYAPKKRVGADACPYNALYWNFLIKHEAKLRANPHMGPNVLSLRHIQAKEREAIIQQAQQFLDALPYYEPPTSTNATQTKGTAD